MDENTCAICSAVKDALYTKQFLWNTPLYETRQFLMIPTIGPLEIGHSIIVSKEHHSNLFSMTNESITEFFAIVDYSIKTIGVDALFFEHGSFNRQTGGSCIEHAHIHVIPTLSSCYNVLDNVLPTKTIAHISELHNEIGCNFPYILSFNLNFGIRLYIAYNAFSQMMRNAICTKLNRTDWDWKKDVDIENIRNTIALWQNH